MREYIYINNSLVYKFYVIALGEYFEEFMWKVLCITFKVVKYKFLEVPSEKTGCT